MDDSVAYELTAEQRSALKRAALNGEYHLMLGAGSSLDSISPDGQRLPNSTILIQQLCTQFNVEAEPGDWLWRVYDRAIESAGQDVVYAWLRKNFWNVRPPHWMNHYARSPWNRVWTLNVDNTFEAAYESVATKASKSLRTLNWDDDYRQTRDLDIVHLHGVVDQDEPRQLVFSLSEYAGSSASNSAWPLNFRDSYGNSPFVILGARLRDEPDIEAIIAKRQPSHVAPSFYVSTTITAPMRKDLLRWGLVPVEMSAEDFVLEWAELTGLDLDKELGDEMELGLRIGQQFIELKKGTRMGPSLGHDFIGGDEPSWADIELGLPADLQWITQAKTHCDQLGKRLNSSSLLVFAGRRLTGRTTGLLQIAKHLNTLSWRTFLFRQNERLDIEAIQAIAAGGKSVALLFDGMADFTDDIDSILAAARQADLNIACIAVEDSNRIANILGRVKPAHLAYETISTIESRLPSTSAARLVDKLESLGRLGILEQQSSKARVRHFTGKDLFDTLAQVENAPGYGRRVGEALKDVSDHTKLSLILIAAYATYVDRKLLVVDAARMITLDTDSLVRLVSNDPQLQVLLSTDGSYIRTRHRWMALDPVVAKLGAVKSLHIVNKAIRQVSGRLNRESFKERNATAMLVGSFMIQRNLKKVFPDTELEPWYSSLSDIFGDWSGRYWEQRAILARRESERDIGMLARAESYALRAAELAPDTYRLTTLGTVLMLKAATAAVDIESYFTRAHEAFDRAAQRDNHSRSSLVTWMAYLRYTLKLIERLTHAQNDKVPTDVNPELLSMINDQWKYRYSIVRLIADASEDVSNDLNTIRQSYDALMQNKVS